MSPVQSCSPGQDEKSQDVMGTWIEVHLKSFTPVGLVVNVKMNPSKAGGSLDGRPAATLKV